MEDTGAGGQAASRVLLYLIASRLTRISHASQLHHERIRRRFVSEVRKEGKVGRRPPASSVDRNGGVGGCAGR